MIGVSNITNRTDPNSLKSRVFVGNLNTVQMSKTELESIFSKYGPVVGISVHKGYAFIQYANEINARAAVTGEDSKSYYNMMLDVTIASEPKNRKRGRSNISSTIPAWNTLASSGLSELALQAQALNSLTGNPVLSLQQLGLEGIMGQPNLAQFAAAASSVFSTPSFPGLNVSTTTATLSSTNTRQKFTRQTLNSSTTSTSTTPMSFAAKRTRLEGGTGNSGGGGGGGSNLNLPLGARGQNLVSLVSPTESSTHGRQGSSPAKGLSSSQSGVSQTNSTTNRSLRSGSMATLRSSSIPPVSTSNPTSPAQRSTSGDSKPSMLRSNRTPTLVNSNDMFSNSQSSGFSRTSGVPSLESNSPNSISRYRTDDILICGRCRRLFEQVDELISHKMAGCTLGKDAGEHCHCRAVGEPDSLDCVYCGATFYSAWELMHHCHSDHGLTIYAIPSPSASPAASIGSASNFSHSSEQTQTSSHPRSHQGLKPENHSSPQCKLDSQSEDTREASDWDPDEQDDDDDHVVEDGGDVEDQTNDSDERARTPTTLDVKPNGSVSTPDKPKVDQEQDQNCRTDDDDNNNNDAGNLSDDTHSPKSKRAANEGEADLVVEQAKERAAPESDPSPRVRRSRRGEYGRHETIEDEDEDDEEEEEQVKSG